MKHHWITDKIAEKIINLIWRPGSLNWDDYFTKHHPASYHKIMRPKYIQKINLLFHLLQMTKRQSTSEHARVC